MRRKEKQHPLQLEWRIMEEEQPMALDTARLVDTVRTLSVDLLVLIYISILSLFSIESTMMPMVR